MKQLGNKYTCDRCRGELFVPVGFDNTVDSVGRMVKAVVNEPIPAGWGSISWQGETLILCEACAKRVGEMIGRAIRDDNVRKA